MAELIPIIAAVNSDDVLNGNLMRSPDVVNGRFQVIAERGHPTAGRAYNAGLSKVKAPYALFVHQDVYLPDGWGDHLTKIIGELESRSEPWGVLGVWGVRSDGQWAGKVWCSGGNCQHVGVSGIQPVSSIDEIVIVLNNAHGLRFDENLPGFHLYATDIILQARERGLVAFVFDSPVVHNSRRNPNPLDKHYRSAYRYMQGKWRAHLPIKTCVVDVTWSGLPLYKRWARNQINVYRGRGIAGPRPSDPVAIAVRLGYGSAGVAR